MATLLERLGEQKVFDAFIQENMKTSTYKSVSKPEMDIEYSASKAYNAYIAEYAAAMAGSIVDKNANKPLHVMPEAGYMYGKIARIADKWQMDNDRLDQYYYMEQRYRDKVANYTQEQNNAEFKKLVKFLFDPFEKAVIAPWKRIDLIYYQGLYNGLQDVEIDKNSKSGVQYAYDLGIQKFYATTEAWGGENATPIEDIEQVAAWAEAHGKELKRVRMSRATYVKMCKSKEIRTNFTAKLTRSQVAGNPTVPLTALNEYFESIELPLIEIEKPKFVLLPNGNQENMIPNDRVVFMFADKVAVLKVADSLENVDRLPNKQYSIYDDNLVGSWRTGEGRFIDYEMWATPVFTGKNDYAILCTNGTSAQAVAGA
jgi:hypothetical protein